MFSATFAQALVRRLLGLFVAFALQPLVGTDTTQVAIDGELLHLFGDWLCFETALLLLNRHHNRSLHLASQLQLLWLNYVAIVKLIIVRKTYAAISLLWLVKFLREDDQPRAVFFEAFGISLAISNSSFRFLVIKKVS
jgi:hypothetical protein